MIFCKTRESLQIRKWTGRCLHIAGKATFPQTTAVITMPPALPFQLSPDELLPQAYQGSCYMPVALCKACSFREHVDVRG